MAAASSLRAWRKLCCAERAAMSASWLSPSVQARTSVVVRSLQPEAAAAVLSMCTAFSAEAIKHRATS